MMLSKVKSGGSLIASKDPSLKQLKALSKVLDRQHKQNTRVVKEIVLMMIVRTMRQKTAGSSRTKLTGLFRKLVMREWC